MAASRRRSRENNAWKTRSHNLGLNRPQVELTAFPVQSNFLNSKKEEDSLTAILILFFPSPNIPQARRNSNRKTLGNPLSFDHFGGFARLWINCSKAVKILLPKWRTKSSTTTYTLWYQAVENRQIRRYRLAQRSIKKNMPESLI
jgi:hypothetical protein